MIRHRPPNLLDSPSAVLGKSVDGFSRIFERLAMGGIKHLLIKSPN
tara:strand:- start:591 stop:728 length:138 start_codon:yes stop_codon:yes gene_type:complete